MYFVELPDIGQQRLSFYLATEEYAARNIDRDPLFFYWQVEPTVIFGRNQCMESEVDVDYCRQHGIQLFRRKSGGGCVYADLGNLMLCYICRGDDVQFTYSRYVTMVLAVLKRLGIDASATGRNDITVGGRKVSGSAFYHIPGRNPGRNIVHSTLLYDTDLGNMTRSLTPPARKLAAKGVESVRSRIALLKDYTPLTLARIKQAFRQMLCGGKTVKLSLQDVSNIREIERSYLDPVFFSGKGRRWTLVKKGRVEGCGELEVKLSLKDGHITAAEIGGDYFAVGDVRGQLLAALRGACFSREALQGIFEKYPPGKYIRGLDSAALLELITQQQ